MLLFLMCTQVPVPNLPAGVHEAGKSVEKADAIFSQERDPRFAEMFAGISACKFLKRAEVVRLWGFEPLSGHLGAATPEGEPHGGWVCCDAAGYKRSTECRGPAGSSLVPAFLSRTRYLGQPAWGL